MPEPRLKLDRRTWMLIAGSAACLLLAMALGMAYISMTYQAPAGEEQPKVTDWMQAWGSIAGVFAGLAAAGAAGALLLHERTAAQEARRQLTDDRQSREEQRARLVITSRIGLDSRDLAVTGVAVNVHNFGPDPIHWVHATVVLPNGGRFVQLDPVEFIGPGCVERIRGKADPRVPFVTGHVMSEQERSGAIIKFTDSSGRTWQRIDNGNPSRQPPSFDQAVRNLGPPHTLRYQ